MDVILFILSGVCALLAILSGVYLIVSSRKGRAYRAVLRQETEGFDALTTAMLAQSQKASAPTDKETELLKTRQPDYDGATEALLEDQIPSSEIPGFDASALEGRYILKSEIHGGGMSRIFLAESAKLGNPWIVKFVSSGNGELVNEENILKLLNHISLPKIVDIFHDDKGVYLIESYIEGLSLDRALPPGTRLGQVIVMEWAEQLTQALRYLHELEPHPIYHFDLKPSNIMVTHDNRLMLIDFGISKRFGADSSAAVGVTYKYAAPEQLKHRIPEAYIPTIESRFGILPENRLQWQADARTDLYSLGTILFELITGQAPTTRNRDLLKMEASHEFASIILKCLKTDPSERYQTAGELLADLQKLKGSKMKMARTLLARRLASVAAAFSVVLSGGSFGGGYYVYTQESAALLDIEPEIVTVSLQQSSVLAIEKRMPNGRVVLLENDEIHWAFSHDNIARVDGNRVSGLNPGDVTLSGQYRDKTLHINVRVVEPMEGMVDISQRYQTGHIAQLFAGTTEREQLDGALGEAEFVSPESIAAAEDGTVYLADSGVLRRIRGGQVETIEFDPPYMTPNIVRCYGNEVYVLTHPWEDTDGAYYAILRLTDDGAEGLLLTEAYYTAIEDFTFSPEGLLIYIERNDAMESVSLKTLDPGNPEDILTLCELPEGTCSLTADENGTIYLANETTGVIQVYRNGELSYFSGIENERAFIDGGAPLFYMPRRVKYSDGFLYVWDFNVLRRLTVLNGAAAECVTIAGAASPVFDLEIAQPEQSAEDIILPNSKLTDFVILGDGVLLTDPKRGVIWRVE